MRDLAAHLGEWTGAGLITQKHADAIVRFEAKRDEPAHAQGAGPLAEAVGYVGAVIALAAVALLLGQGWADLNVGGRLAIVALLTVIIASAGVALRSSDTAPIQRLVSVLLVGGVVGVVWIVGIVVTDIAGWRENDIALAVGGAALAMALPLYVRRRRALPQLATLTGALILVVAIFARPAFTGDVSWLGLAVWSVGAAWALLALGKYLEPEALAAATGTAVAIIGVAAAAYGPARVAMLIIGLTTAGLVLARGVLRDATYLVAIGAIGVLIFFPQLVIHLFGDSAGAMIAMLVVGLMLVLLAVRLVRGRRHD